MARWKIGKSATRRQPASGPARRTTPAVETLEDRTVPSATAVAPAVAATAPAGLTVAPGYHVTTFATNPAGASQPDSITLDGRYVFVGYGNGVAKDGSDGKSSTIVEYNLAGQVVHTFSVPGHNDGLKVDPYNGKIWALQNEDGNPNLVVINPFTRTQTNYTFGPVADGGGYDDIAFLHGKAYLTESNPQANPNTAPAVVQAILRGTTVEVRPVLFGDATAFNKVTKEEVMLNLQDPDSMTVGPGASLVFTSQADDELLTVRHPGQANQSATVLPLTDEAGKPVSVDDTLFLPGGPGEVLFTDLSTGTIYRVTGPALESGGALSAAPDIGEVGTLNTHTGVFTPVISGLGSPRGLLFVPAPGDE
jgi:hypothetical protein